MAPAVAFGVTTPRSNDDVADERFAVLPITNPGEVVGVEPLIPIVATETPAPDADANAIGVADESP